jgi:hypothetical protein
MIIQTVEERKRNFSKQEVEDAEEARRLMSLWEDHRGKHLRTCFRRDGYKTIPLH